MRIQNTADGMLRKSIVRLHPKHADMTPNVNEPHMAPIEVIEPTHEICSFVNGPDMSGVSSEESFGRAGDIHPRIVPWPSITRLPESNVYKTI